jgi:hypothetical protein
MALKQALEVCGSWRMRKGGAIYRKVEPIVADLVLLILFAISILTTMISFVSRCSR